MSLAPEAGAPIAYMLEGECVVRFGDRMQHEVLVRQGDHAFVPADLPHAPCNESGAPCTWLVVHSSGSDQDGIAPPPELDACLRRDSRRRSSRRGRPKSLSTRRCVSSVRVATVATSERCRGDERRVPVTLRRLRRRMRRGDDCAGDSKRATVRIADCATKVG